jgi:hypothetical protein
MGVFLLLLAQLAAAGDFDGPVGEISGTAVNGSIDGAPLAGAEVVLRASQNGAFVPVAVTTTDSQGLFRFANLPADESVIYLAGVNRAGIHYPGPRVRFVPGRYTARVKLIAYDTVESPSPLVVRRHEISLLCGEGYLEVTEKLLVENPRPATYVGQSRDDHPPVTLRLSLPEGVEKVTFEREFHGRNFRFQTGQLITELPWQPGSRELTIIYRVPVEQRYSVFTRVLDQPTDHVAVRVVGKSESEVACNIPLAGSPSGRETVFEHDGKTLAAGYEISVRLGAMPLRFETYARWLAVAALVALVAGSVVVAGVRRLRSAALREKESSPPVSPSRTARRRSRRAHRITSSQPHR